MSTTRPWILVAALFFAGCFSGCATKAALEETVTEIGRTANQANTGIAAVSTSTQILLATVNSEVAASGSSTRALMDEARVSLTETRLLLGTIRAEIAANGSATVVLADSLSGLAKTVKDGLAANSSSTLATTAAIASTTRELDALLVGMRPNLIAASAEVTSTLVNVREMTKKISDRADDPLISNETHWILRVMLGAIALLLLHSVWTHLHLRRIAKKIVS